MEVIEFMSVVTIIGYRSVSSVYFNDRLVSFELFMQLILISHQSPTNHCPRLVTIN